MINHVGSGVWLREVDKRGIVDRLVEMKDLILYLKMDTI